MTEDREPYRAGEPREAHSTFAWNMYKLLAADAKEFAATGVCPRCQRVEHSARDGEMQAILSEMQAILSGTTLHCIVCGKEIAW